MPEVIVKLSEVIVKLSEAYCKVKLYHMVNKLTKTVPFG
jgi:hypothetical protein